MKEKKPVKKAEKAQEKVKVEPKNEYRFERVHLSTHKKLVKLQHKDESMNELIKRLLKNAKG